MAAQRVANRPSQNRAVSCGVSMPRWWSRLYTFRNSGGQQTYITTAKRIISGPVSKQRKMGGLF